MLSVQELVSALGILGYNPELRAQVGTTTPKFSLANIGFKRLVNNLPVLCQ